MIITTHTIMSDTVPVTQGQRWRHVKRGTEYEVIGVAELQAIQPQHEHADLAIYRGDDGKLWARNTGEFGDGRFIHVHEPAPSPAPLPEEVRELVIRANAQIELGKATGAHTGSTFNIYQIAEELLADLTRAPKPALDRETVAIDALKPFAAMADEWDRWQAKGSTSTPAMLRLSYGRCSVELTHLQAARAAIHSAEGRAP